MSIVTRDTFTVASDTALTSHAPDVGTTWVQVVLTGTAVINCIATTDVASPSANGTGGGQCDKSQPSPASAQYDVSFQLAAIDTLSNDRPIRLHGRLTGSTTYYSCQINPTARTQNSGVELKKSNAGTVTILASVDRTHAVNDVYLLSIRDSLKSVYVNGGELLTSSDNVLTTAGDAALSMGFVHTNDGGNIHQNWDVDNYLVTNPTAPPPPRAPWRSIARRAR